MTLSAARSEAGHAFLELREVTDDAGNPVEHEVAATFALGVGALNGAIERFGLSKVLEDVPGADKLFGAIGREGAKAALRNAKVQAIARGAVRGATVEGLTELIQESTTVAATIAELYLQGKTLDDFEHEVDGEVLTGAEAIWARVLSAGRTGAQFGFGLGAGGSAGGVVARTRAVENAVQTAKWLGGVSDTAIRSKLREGNPEAFGEHVERATEGGVETVLIDAEAVHGWLNEASPSDARDMLEAVEAFRVQAREVGLSGGPYVVPMADYLTHVAPSGMRAAVEQDVRIAPEAMTEREAQLVRQDLPTDFDSATQDDDARRRLSDALGALREGRRPVRDALPETPVLSLLRDLGGIDPDSDLGQALVERVPRSGRGSIRGLFRSDSTLTPDTIVANESPVLADTFGDREITADELLEAVDRELAGEPLRSSEQGAAIAEEEQGFADLEQSMADLGLSLDDDDRTILAGILPPPEEFDFVTGQPLSESQTIEQMIADEATLAREQGLEPTPFSQARADAERVVRSSRVRDLSPHRYRVQAAKEGRLAFAAAQRGDFSTAQAHKLRQIFNAFAEDSARRAKERTRNHARYAASLQTKSAKERIGKAGPEYLEQVDGLLDRFDLRLSTPLKSLTRRQSIREWILSQEVTGETVIIPDRLRDEAFRTSWKSISVNDFDELVDSLKNIEQIARRKTRLLLARDEAEFDDARSQLIESAIRHLKVRPESANLNPDRIEQIREQFLSAHGSLVKVEFLVDQLDGGDPNGPWRRFVYTPIAQAEAERNDLNTTYTLAFVELAEKLMKGKRAEYGTREFYPELGFRLTKEELLSVALNMGNTSNMEKLIGGYANKAWTQESVESVLNRTLGKADWEFVQGVWDLIESLWPRIVEQQRRLVGVTPKKVDPREFENAHGSWRGGYYPVQYDPDKARFAFRNESRGLFEGIEAAFKKPITGHGFTIERTNIVGPLRLDLKVVPGHLDQVIHDLTHRDVLMQIDELLEDADVHEAVGRTLGKPASRLFRPWLQGIATDRITQEKGLDTIQKWSRAARQNLTTFTLGFRWLTLAAQVAGFSNGVAVLRQHLPETRRYLFRGIRKAYAGGSPLDMQGSWERAAEQSGEMRHRIGQIDKDMRDVLRRNVGSTTAPAWLKRTAMQLIGKVQMLAVDLPIWYAAYEGGVEAHGLEHRQAVEFADSMVRMSQGAAGAKDLSAIQRADEGWRAYLLFFTWRNTLYNQLASTLSTVRRDGNRSKRVSSLVLMTVLPAIWSGLIRGEFEDEEDWWDVAKEMLRLNTGEMLGTLPLIDWAGAVSPFIGGPRFSTGTPAQRIANITGEAVGDVVDVAVDDDRRADLDLVLSLVRVAGLGSGSALRRSDLDRRRLGGGVGP